MKKMFLSAALLLATSVMFIASAQQQESTKPAPTPEQKAEFQANKVANILMLSDDTAKKFVPLYKSYKLELSAVNEKYRPAKRDDSLKGQPLSDKEVDAKIRSDFAKSGDILNVRIAYYEKFLKVLSPKQIKKMYEEEKATADAAAHRRWEKCHGPQGCMEHNHKPGECKGNCEHHPVPFK